MDSVLFPQHDRRVSAMKRLLLGLVTLGLFLGVTAQAKADYDFTTYDVPDATSTNLGAAAINDRGQIVGQYDDAGGTTHGYLLSEGSYTTLDVPGSTLTSANGINDRGQIVGHYRAGGIQHGYLLSRGGFTTIDVPGSTATNARAINASGQIAGWYVDAGGATHGFLAALGHHRHHHQADFSFTTFDVPRSTFTTAHGINASGQIVGRYDDAGGMRHGFLLSKGSYTTLDVPGSTLTAAFGINNPGEIVGSYIDEDGIRHGFLLSDDGYTTLDPPGSTDPFAYGINASGEIVGTYTDASGTNHGFFATPVP
jgi:probable HAF family extracellular repeat protein